MSLDITERLEWDKRYTYGHVPVTLADAKDTIIRLRAEVERLQPAAGGDMNPQKELEHWRRIAGQGLQTEHALRVELIEVAAFLDRLADNYDFRLTFTTLAADCRAMAKKLRDV
jgi:hypothetical protein